MADLGSFKASSNLDVEIMQMKLSERDRGLSRCAGKSTKDNIEGYHFGDACAAVYNFSLMSYAMSMLNWSNRF